MEYKTFKSKLSTKRVFSGKWEQFSVQWEQFSEQFSVHSSV